MPIVYNITIACRAISAKTRLQSTVLVLCSMASCMYALNLRQWYNLLAHLPNGK